MQGWRLAFERNFAADWDVIHHFYSSLSIVFEQNVEVSVINTTSNVKQSQSDFVFDLSQPVFDVYLLVLFHEFVNRIVNDIFGVITSVLLQDLLSDH